MKLDPEIKGKSLTSLMDLTDEQMVFLLNLSQELKKRRKSGLRDNLLKRKNIAMIFEKMSTRTRCSVAVAIADEGGHTEYLSAGEIHLGVKESIPDTARVLGRMFDGIFFRGYKQKTVELLSEYAGVPVWNGLTDKYHPTQVLADLLTVKERFGKLAGLKFVYVGDGRNNVANSLMLGCAKAGLDFVNCTPSELMPEPEIVNVAEKIAVGNGGSVSVVNDPVKGTLGANVIYTDVWASMGEEAKLSERIALLKPYQVNMDMIRNTGNMESDEVIFLHCLPAFHNRDTDLTKDIGEMEVSDDVFEAPFSLVFDEAENRMHTIKAMFVASLCDAEEI